MITCEGIIIFPVLFEPKENLSGDLKFSCSFLVDKISEAGVKAMEAEVQKAIAKGKETIWGGKVPRFNYDPIRDGDHELEEGIKEGSEYQGRIFINPSTDPDYPPQVVDVNLRPITDPGRIYSGCIVRLDVKAYPFKKGGNNGVGWGLNNVMLIRESDRLDGRMNAVDAFAGYAQEVDTDTDADADELA